MKSFVALLGVAFVGCGIGNGPEQAAAAVGDCVGSAIGFGIGSGISASYDNLGPLRDTAGRSVDAEGRSSAFIRIVSSSQARNGEGTVDGTLILRFGGPVVSGDLPRSQPQSCALSDSLVFIRNKKAQSVLATVVLNKPLEPADTEIDFTLSRMSVEIDGRTYQFEDRHLVLPINAMPSP